MRRATLVVALTSVLTACGATPTMPRSPDSFASSASTARATGEPSEDALAAPGRPFDAEAILTAMRDSRRPGGVPDELETDAIASAVAAAIWTYTGRPWTTMAASGSCAPETCTLELAGAVPGSQGDDLWIFSVDPTEAAVEVTTAELRALPKELMPSLDTLARFLLADQLNGLLLTNARWLPPPDDGLFELAFRGDGEEGSCMIDLTLDVVAEAIVGVPRGNC